jgi:hypothetical protein
MAPPRRRHRHGYPTGHTEEPSTLLDDVRTDWRGQPDAADWRQITTSAVAITVRVARHRGPRTPTGITIVPGAVRVCRVPAPRTTTSPQPRCRSEKRGASLEDRGRTSFTPVTRGPAARTWLRRWKRRRTPRVERGAGAPGPGHHADRTTPAQRTPSGGRRRTAYEYIVGPLLNSPQRASCARRGAFRVIYSIDDSTRTVTSSTSSTSDAD